MCLKPYRLFSLLSTSACPNCHCEIHLPPTLAHAAAPAPLAGSFLSAGSSAPQHLLPSLFCLPLLTYISSILSLSGFSAAVSARGLGSISPAAPAALLISLHSTVLIPVLPLTRYNKSCTSTMDSELLLENLRSIPGGLGIAAYLSRPFEHQCLGLHTLF